MTLTKGTLDYYVRIAVVTFMCFTSALPATDRSSENETADKATTYFKTDEDITNYLKLYDTDVMLWRCRNAMALQWTGSPIKEVDLYCEVLGKVKSIDLFHNYKKLGFGGRFKVISHPHKANGHFFTQWMDYRIRISHATRRDSGTYIMRVKSPHGNMEMQMIFLDISKKKERLNKDENESAPKINKRRRRRRRKGRLLKRRNNRSRRRMGKQ